MHPLLLSGHLPDLSGLAPFFIAPIATILLLFSIPAIRYLSRHFGFGNGFVLFLLGVLNFVPGLFFLYVCKDVCAHANPEYFPHNWVIIVLAFIGSAVMTIAGGYALWAIVRRMINGRED